MNDDFFPVTCNVCNNHFWLKSRVPSNQYVCEKCKTHPTRLNTIGSYEERLQSANVKLEFDPNREYSKGAVFYKDEIKRAIIMWKKDRIERFTDGTVFKYPDEKKQMRTGMLDYKRLRTMLSYDILHSPLEKILRS